jgi:hypothetical protein
MIGVFSFKDSVFRSDGRAGAQPNCVKMPSVFFAIFCG